VNANKEQTLNGSSATRQRSGLAGAVTATAYQNHSEPPETQTMKKKPESAAITLETDPDGRLKRLGGGRSDKWNMRLVNQVVGTIPDLKAGTDEAKAECRGVLQGISDVNPADPVEGILIGQIMAANEASLAMYRKGWAQPPEYFTARTKYLQLADKAARTVMMLTERLDHHRGRGQQQIVVRHVTVNADHAMVAETITASGAAPVPGVVGGPPPLDYVTQPDIIGTGRGDKNQ